MGLPHQAGVIQDQRDLDPVALGEPGSSVAASEVTQPARLEFDHGSLHDSVAAHHVGATVLAAIITGFGAAVLKHKWDVEDDKQRWERERRERFVDVKRELYVRWLDLMGPRVESMQHLFSQNKDYPSDPAKMKHLPSFTDEVNHEAGTLRQEIRLIAPPDVVSAVEVSWASYIAAALTVFLPDQYPFEKRKQNSAAA